MDPLDQWEQRQQTRGQSKMSPRARELAAKNAGRVAASRAAHARDDQTFKAWGGIIFVSLLMSPLFGTCGAVLGGAVTGGNTAGIVIGAIAMVVVPIPFAVQRHLRKEEERAAKQRFAAEQYEIHRHNVRRARGKN